MYRLILT